MNPRTYVRTLWQSLSSPRYYLDVLNAPFFFSLRFFLLSYFLLTIIASLLFFTLDMPRYRQQFDQSLQELQAAYPTDLQVTWTGNELQTNSQEPIHIGYPSFLQLSKNMPATLGFILPEVKNEAEITSAISKSTWWVISQHSIYIPDGVGNWTKYPLQEVLDSFPPFTLTQESLPKYIEQWKTVFSQSLTIFAFLYPIGWLLFFTIVRFIMTFIYSLIVFFFLNTINRSFPLKKVFQVSLHVSVVSEIVYLIGHYLVPTADAPMYLVTFWAYFIFIISNLWNVKQIPRMKN